MDQVAESRVNKTLLNARVNLVFYMLSLFVSFFTRKIFLDKLGIDFVGLSTTLQNLLGFLNLAELGIGSAIGYVLYKPLFDKDETKLNEIISVFGYIYRWIGMVIILAGVILSFFLPLIFKDVSIDLGVIYYVYYSFLASSLLGYFVNYKQTLLGADQKNYVVAGYLQTTVILKTILQAALAYYTQNYYVWATNEIIFGVIFSLILNWKIGKVYPWLQSDIKLGNGLLKKYPEIFKYTKQLFVHKISMFAQFQMIPILTYSFTTLKTVALYGNYIIIIDKVVVALNQLFDSTAASIGNLISENNKSNSIKVFWELFALRFYAAGLIVFCIYHLISPFIYLWLGEEFLLDDIFLFLIAVRIFINLTRTITGNFLNGFGLFADVWAAISETVLFLIFAILGGYYWGLNGIILANILSSFFIIWIWKPIYLFSCGFMLPLKKYWVPFMSYLLVTIFSWIITTLLISRIKLIFNPYDSIVMWSIYAMIITLTYLIFSFISFFLCSKGFQRVVRRFVKSDKI